MSFPYRAYVLSENVDVVAGPGHRFYATDRLARGTQVEIYREEASGWLAIRPPEGSFSWIPAEFVERLEDDQLGRVKEPTGAWIGTSVEHVSEHQQQVTLKAGELVQIIGDKTAAAKEGEKRTWLKISPPAGEYRWVHLRDVGRQKPEDPMPKVAAETKYGRARRGQPSPRPSPRGRGKWWSRGGSSWRASRWRCEIWKSGGRGWIGRSSRRSFVRAPADLECRFRPMALFRGGGVARRQRRPASSRRHSAARGRRRQGHGSNRSRELQRRRQRGQSRRRLVAARRSAAA